MQHKDLKLPRKARQKITLLIAAAIRFDRQYPAELLDKAERILRKEYRKKGRYSYEMQTLLSSARVALAEHYAHNELKRRM